MCERDIEPRKENKCYAEVVDEFTMPCLKRQCLKSRAKLGDESLGFYCNVHQKIFDADGVVVDYVPGVKLDVRTLKSTPLDIPQIENLLVQKSINNTRKIRALEKQLQQKDARIEELSSHSRPATPTTPKHDRERDKKHRQLAAEHENECTRLETQINDLDESNKQLKATLKFLIPNMKDLIAHLSTMEIATKPPLKKLISDLTRKIDASSKIT